METPSLNTLGTLSRETDMATRGKQAQAVQPQRLSEKAPSRVGEAIVWTGQKCPESSRNDSALSAS